MGLLLPFAVGYSMSEIYLFLVLGSYGFLERYRKENWCPRALCHMLDQQIYPPTSSTCQTDQILRVSHVF